MVTVKDFGEFKGAPVREFIISRGKLRAHIIEYGAILRSLVFDGRDIVLGYDDLAGYLADSSNQGATVGRYANRIGGGAYELAGKSYALDKNENGTTTLHGGAAGFGKRLFKGEKAGESSVKMSLFSKSGEGGFNGDMDFSVTFTVVADRLRISYEATCTEDTVMNFTNHAYFNLGGRDCLSTELCIKAQAITPVDALLIPTGELLDIAGTEFDFSVPRAIGDGINGDHPQIKLCGGYDHNFVLGQARAFRDNVAVAYCPESGIRLACSTDMPGIQLYTSNMLNEPRGKGGAPLKRHSAFCLETQFWPDSPNKPDFPSCVVKAGEKFMSVTEYAISE